VADLAQAVQAATGENVQVAFVDQGYTGEQPAAAAEQGIHLEEVKHHEAKRGFVLSPRRWVVERSFAWVARFRLLARDYERLASSLTVCRRLVTGRARCRCCHRDETKHGQPGLGGETRSAAKQRAR